MLEWYTEQCCKGYRCNFLSIHRFDNCVILGDSILLCNRRCRTTAVSVRMTVL